MRGWGLDTTLTHLLVKPHPLEVSIGSCLLEDGVELATTKQLLHSLIKVHLSSRLCEHVCVCWGGEGGERRKSALERCGNYISWLSPPSLSEHFQIEDLRNLVTCSDVCLLFL